MRSRRSGFRDDAGASPVARDAHGAEERGATWKERGGGGGEETLQAYRNESIGCVETLSVAPRLEGGNDPRANLFIHSFRVIFSVRSVYQRYGSVAKR